MNRLFKSWWVHFEMRPNRRYFLVIRKFFPNLALFFGRAVRQEHFYMTFK
jgi:hypothetical protein